MEDIIKTCYKCKISKLLSDFNKCKHGTFGVHGHCRQCQKEVRKNFYDTIQKPTKYWLTPEHKSLVNRVNKKRYASDIEWREKIKLNNNVRRRTEPAKIVARIQRKKWYNIPKNRIACSLRVRLRKALRHNQKVDITEKLLGCSFDYAKQHLESNFQSGMKWENYGKWHIDHIIPCSRFDLTIPHQQKMCFNYRNLQPMWAKENISKNNRITIEDMTKIMTELQQI